MDLPALSLIALQRHVKSATVCRVKVKVEVVPQALFSLVFESRDGEVKIVRGKCVPYVDIWLELMRVAWARADVK